MKLEAESGGVLWGIFKHFGEEENTTFSLGYIFFSAGGSSIWGSILVRQN